MTFSHEVYLTLDCYQVLATTFDAVQRHQSFSLWHSQELRKQRDELASMQVQHPPRVSL